MFNIKKTLVSKLADALDSHYEEKYAPSNGQVGFAIFMMVLPLLLAGGIGAWEWWQKQERGKSDVRSRIHRLEDLLEKEISKKEKDDFERAKLEEAQEILTRITWAKQVVAATERKEEEERQKAAG